MSTRKGFDGNGFAVGTVTGLRWWNLAEDGKLHGAREPWEPGENVAKCLRHYGWPDLTETPHAVPEDDCHCGFWGYWQRSSAPEVGGPHPVLGVVEGYGSTLVGDLGFRCAKAKIVALHCAFTVKVPARPETPLVSQQGLWTPDPGMFRRGPGGMDTYNAMTAGGHHADTELCYVEDPEALLGVQNCLEALYDVPVYSNFDAMIAMHPPTTDYLPPPTGYEVTAKLDTATLKFPVQDIKEVQAALDRIHKDIMATRLAALQLNTRRDELSVSWGYPDTQRDWGESQPANPKRTILNWLRSVRD